MKKAFVLLFALLLAAGCNSATKVENGDNSQLPDANIQTKSGTTVNVLEDLNKSLSAEESVYTQTDSDVVNSDSEVINSYGEIYNAN
jgi:uncharacterized protein YcfL